MTATCNRFVIKKLQLFTNLDLEIPQNVFWLNAIYMGHRHIFFDITYTIRPLQTFQAHIGPLLHKSHLEKYIYYVWILGQPSIPRFLKSESELTRTVSRLTNFSTVGKQMHDQKFYHIHVFNRSNQPNLQILDDCAEIINCSIHKYWQPHPVVLLMPDLMIRRFLASTCSTLKWGKR
jgi:hypothetical protein